MVLVDTSVMIDFLKGNDNTKTRLFDEMLEIYAYIEACDNIVIASPIWFSSLSGPILNLTSRLQTIYASSYFRKSPLNIKKKMESF